MELNKIKNVYLLGIGGIGMSALARYFKHLGKNVAGYDKVKTGLTAELESQDIPVIDKDDPALIPPDFINDKKKTLVVYTPAVPANINLMKYFDDNDFTVIKRASAVGEISKSKFTIAVGGTHGKTTTTAMIIHVLKNSGIDCFALVGGISSNYQSNFIPPAKKDADVFVVEADEFDRSFHELNPNVIVITSTDADHLDTYENAHNVVVAYQEFAFKLKKSGTFIRREKLNVEPSEMTGRSYTFGLTKNADIYPTNIRKQRDSFVFDLNGRFESIKDVKFSYPGDHNILNCLAAYTASRVLLKNGEEFKKAIASFKGVKRRFEYIINTPAQVYIDDYAHHPAELAATISTMKQLYPGKKITGVFQPHLFSRTRDFAREFGKSLSELDKVILLDIYPAREKPNPKITSELIFKYITSPEKLMATKEQLLDLVKKEKTDVLATFGAGDIDLLVEPIKQILSSKE